MSSIIQDYRREWTQEFVDLQAVLKHILGNLAIEIHHVGSTSIPGMLAKPILDIDVEISDRVPIETISARLRLAGYEYQGTQGIPDRHAYGRESDSVPFVDPPRVWMKHHLYVLPAGATELRRHLHFRDSLVASPELQAEYRELKQRCATAASGDRTMYQTAKEASPFFERVLAMPLLTERMDRASGVLEDLESRLASGEIDEAGWYRAVASVITPAYLAGDNPRSQSGHSGDDPRWTRARSLIADAVDSHGTFLDIGCASGYLMECIKDWSHARGFAIEPHGLDSAPELADLARRRLPHWADRIHVGNALSWKPNVRFDFVRTGLEYVPKQRRRDLIAHLLNEIVAADGRLIIGTYNEARAYIIGPDLEQSVASWDFTIAGRTSRPHDDCRLAYKVFWIDQARRTAKM
jgi:GrpB-like predicted nucleotidyltransferase (UPF0157 family)